MAKYRNKTNSVLSFTIGEKELRREFIIFPGESAELPNGNSYIASIEAQGIIEKLPAKAKEAEPATVGNPSESTKN